MAGDANATVIDPAANSEKGGTADPTAGLSEEAKAIIQGLGKSNSKQDLRIKELEKELADKAAAGKPAVEDDEIAKLRAKAALADLLEENEEYTAVLPTLRTLVKSGVTPTKELADTLLEGSAATSSGSRSQGGKGTTTGKKTSDEETLLRGHNLWGDPLR